MKLGIYSGTFDPIHEGHVLFAQVACEQFGLDEVIFIPEEAPRYKDGVQDVISRRAMIKLATADFPNMQLFEHNEPSHTIEGVISAVVNDYPDDEYFIIMGSDVYKGIPKWGTRDDERGAAADIKDSVGFIVGLENIEELKELEKVQELTGLNTRFLESPLSKLSSRNIRRAIKSGDEPKGLNDDVKEFIKQSKIYSS